MRIEIFENERATNYNQFVETWIPNYNYFLDYLPIIIQDTTNKDLLIVGCGTGNEIEKFRNFSKEWEITGIDPSPEMIEQAEFRFQNCENIKIVEGIVTDLNINRKYGAATLLLVLHFMEDNGDKENLLKEIANRLEPNAPFIMLDITGNANQIKQNLRILKSLLPKHLNSDEIESRLKRIENELFIVSEERIIELFVKVGFEPPVRFFQSSIYVGWITSKRDMGN